MKKLLYEFTKTVPAPIEAVRRRLRAALPGWAESGDGVFWIQGGWWYRGEYELTTQTGGTRVTHRVFNVAKVGRWAVPMANRFFIGFERQTRAQFEQGCTDLATNVNMEITAAPMGSGAPGGNLGGDGLPNPPAPGRSRVTS
jgi:hypothetical protein